MVTVRNILLATLCILGVGVSAAHFTLRAYGSDFTAFAEDENVCRRVGTAAIKGGAGPAAAQRYDFAYRRCMVSHGRMRQMGAYQESGPPGPGYAGGNVHGFEYPDAFYSVPYATPGYGYDGFSY